MNFFRVFTILFSLIFFPFCQTPDTGHDEPLGADNLAYRWGKVAMEATANDTEKFFPRPTVTSRYLGLIWTAAYDAWSRFDTKANPVMLKGVERIAESKRNLRNKEIAISYALYRTMMVYFQSDSAMLTNNMRAFGFDPSNVSEDPATPIGIGNLAAKAVVEGCLNDGSNQAGTLNGPGGKPYSDYSGYRPVNTPDSSYDVKHWQPKYFADGKGGKFAPACLTPHWGKVKPVMLDSAAQFRPGPPPVPGSVQMQKELEEVVTLQANLTNEQKALVEFMRDGPRSVQQAGHWFMFAQEVSVRDKHTLDDDIKMFFMVETAAMDAFIACWDAKMYYDFARPYALVHHYYKGKTITGWKGEGKGWGTLKGEDWRPYSPATFLCPAFPSYVSGHSTVSGACGMVLKLFKGNDTFGLEVKRIPGELTEPDNLGAPVVLKFPTFTEAADMAGISRVMGGYHIQSENVEGLKLGRSVGAYVYEKCRSYIEGTK